MVRPGTVPKCALALLLVAATAGCASGGAGDRRACHFGDRPGWSVRTDPGTVKHTAALSHTALRAETLTLGAAGSRSARHLGQSYAGSRFEARLRLARSVDPAGEACTAVRSLDVSLRYTRREVRIARELAGDACLRREVETHELRHVALDDRLIEEFEPVLRERVEALAQDLAPIVGTPPGEAAAALKAEVDEVLAELGAEFDQLRRRRHRAEIDTPEEYARTVTMCGGRAPALLAAAR